MSIEISVSAFWTAVAPSELLSTQMIS